MQINSWAKRTRSLGPAIDNGRISATGADNENLSSTVLVEGGFSSIAADDDGRISTVTAVDERLSYVTADDGSIFVIAGFSTIKLVQFNSGKSNS